LREAIAAFGPTGTSVDLASPATPEAVFWAIETVREENEPAAATSENASQQDRRVPS
ncbi:MAG: hypothetical protein GX920_03355, partial [Micrococcus sp.]|nr:hypothetical protein [Micrococcus sp.]